MDYSSLRPPSIHLVPLQPFPRYDTNLAGRSYIRCHYSLIFVPQTVLREDVTSRSQMILADYPGASEGNRTPVCRMAIYCTNRCTTPAFSISVADAGSVRLNLLFFRMVYEPTTESGAE